MSLKPQREYCMGTGYLARSTPSRSLFLNPYSSQSRPSLSPALSPLRYTHSTALAEFDALLRSELEKVDQFYADREAEIEVREKLSSLIFFRFLARFPSSLLTHPGG